MTIDPHACCACGGSRWQTLESIDFERQHKLYAKDDAGLCNALTAAVCRHAPGYQMHRCLDCGLEAALPLTNPGSDWYGLAYGALSLYPAHRWEFDRVISGLNATARIADFGCGSGKFLAACRSAGLTATGYDFSPEAIEACAAQGLQARVWTPQQTGQLLEEGATRYSHITSFHVLEHLDDPIAFFQLAAISTTANGQLLISVPSDRRMSRVFGETDFLDQPPHHLTRWTRAALQQLGQRTGWILTKFDYEPWPLSHELWARAIRQPGYLRRISANSPRWLERVLRVAYYPSAARQTVTAAHRLSGFSMLAKFAKVRDPAPPAG